MIEAIGIGVFVFVSLAVAGWRALDLLDRKAREEAAELERRITAAKVAAGYKGPYVNRWGREFE